MEWSNIHYSPLEETLHGLFSSTEGRGGWTYQENKVFENALAEIDVAAGSPAFFESVASKIPWKSIQEIETHYQALIEDLNKIESGQFLVPDYQQQHGNKDEGRSSSNEAAKTRSSTGQPRRRGVPWTEEEHQLFLMGLNKYGKGDWRSISRYYVITKTPTQVASHAQKYFRRQTSSTPVDRRRPSIHDIQTVNPPAPTTFTSPVQVDDPIPFTSSDIINPMLQNKFNAGIVVDDHNPAMFLPTFPPDHPIFDHSSIAYSATGSYLFPSPGDQQWG